MEKFAEFRRAGKTVVLVSHALGSMRNMCEEAAWLEHGKLVEVGSASDVVDTYVDSGHAERETLNTGASRWGSGEVRLTAVELLDVTGEPTTHVHTGDDVTLRLHYEADEAIERPVFGFAMENLDGVYVWAYNTLDGNFTPDVIHGPGRLDLHIPRLMLQPGIFDMLAAVVDHTTTHTYDFLRHCLRFDVDLGDPRESGGIVALDGQWQDHVKGPGEGPLAEAAAPADREVPTRP